MRAESLEQLFRRFVLAAAPAAALGACCPDETVILTLPQETHDALVQQHGDRQALPEATCQELCMVEPQCLFPDGGEGNWSACGAVANGFSRIHECKLVHVDWTQPAVSCYGTVHCPGGRRPEGMVLAGVGSEASLVGAFFARQAQLEAASVPAFRRLGRELRAHGAPEALVRACTRAARDEVAHARAMARLARRFGAPVPAPRVPALPVRTLEEVAVENMAEGCVRETYGALLATWQAGAAARHEVRAALGPIARDETRHAEFSWAVAEWSLGRLSPRAQQRVERAREAEVEELHAQAAETPHPVLAREAGLPTAAQAAQLLASCRESLWGARAA